MSGELVSVIVPAFNHERWITECLDSVAAETWRPLELIVIDDGSRDGTWSAIQRWQAPDHLSITRVHQENVGITRTLNRALELAKGRWYTVVASDDMLLEGGIASRAAVLEREPEVAAVFGDAVVVNSEGERVAQSALSLRGARTARMLVPRNLQREIVGHWGIVGPVLLADRERVRQLGGYDERLKVEDWDFYMRLVSRDALRFVPEVVAEYRVHDRNVSQDAAHGRERANEERLVLTRNARLFPFMLRLRMYSMAAWRTPPLLKARRLLGPVRRWAGSSGSPRARRRNG